MADYAIHDSTLTGIANVIRKKDGTSALIDPADYADRINLMGMLEEKTTTSASIAHIEDGASEVPLKNWLVTLPASLSGYTAVNGTKNTGTGTTETQYTASLGRTIYGGQADIVTGEGTDGYSGIVDLNSLNWAKTTISGHDAFYASLPDGYLPTGSSGFDGACDSYEVTQDTTLGTNKTIRFYYNSSYNFSRCIIRDDDYANATAPEFKQAVTGNIVYKLADSAVTPFTFTPITPTPETENVCNFWADGDSEVTYRAVDTVQPIPPVPPTLISKTVTANGTYEAEDDDADGYDEVTVNVPPYSFMPTWTETKLVDNTSFASAITFSEDYHNYQMLRFVIYNSSTQIYDSIFVLPSGIDKAFTYSSNKFCLNQQITGYTNQYVTYQEDSLLEWSRTGNRNCNVYEVYGMTFTNATMTTEVIYSRDAVASTNVTPTPPTGKTFFDYDAIIYMCCTTDTNITHFCKWWITKPKMSLFTDSVGYGIPLFAYNAGKPVIFTETSIGTYGFFYVVGLNFTAT